MSGWTAADKFHDNLKEAMQPYQGKQLKTAEINKILQGAAGTSQHARVIQPLDHCKNEKKFGACSCAQTDKAIFEHVHRGVFLVRTAN